MEISNKQLFKAEEIRAFAGLDANLYGLDVLVSAKVVQDTWLLGVLGENLFDRLAAIAEPGDPQTVYDTLRSTYVLPVVAWGVRADIEPQLHNKIRNAGVVRSTDERIVGVSQNEMKENMLRYENRMKFYLEKLIEYLRSHRSGFPEWNDRTCENHERGDERACSTRGGKIIAGIYLDH